MATDSSWPWPDSFDALVAAPKHHTLVLENDRVRVLDTRIPPGDTAPVHTHRWPGVYYVIQPGDFVRRDGEGTVLLDTRTAPRAVAQPAGQYLRPLPPHSVENVGPTEIWLISIELKE